MKHTKRAMKRLQNAGLFGLSPAELSQVAKPVRLVKSQAPGRNDPCSCGSGLKFKKCCLHRTTRVVAAPSAPPVKRDHPGAKPAYGQPRTLQAMRDRGISEKTIWIYAKTGIFITEQNKSLQSREKLDLWEAAAVEYDKL